jgi:phosphoribosylpyrophosphate synthetase
MLQHMLRDSGASHIVVHAGFLVALGEAVEAIADDSILKTVIIVGDEVSVPQAAFRARFARLRGCSRR